MQSISFAVREEVISLGSKLYGKSGSKFNYSFFSRMTPAEAAAYLRDDRIVLQDFGDVLREMYPRSDLRERLTAAFEADGNGGPAVRRKIWNWLDGQSHPSTREDVFHIAFALGLSESQANFLLGLCSDYGIHYRSGRDMVYAWFLRTGRGYRQARDFFASLPPPIRPSEPLPTGSGIHVTHELYDAFLRVANEEELRAAYLANLPRFGALHLRAYAYFENYFDQLTHPEPDWDGDEEPDYSVETVMERYLTMHMPSGRSRAGFSVAQKLIKQNWPNATVLRNIRTGQADVPRKVLLLLYVVTENVFNGGYREVDETYIGPRERFEDHWWTLNAIMADCGMPALDPRNPTDWLVLYALTARDEPMSGRMEKVIRRLYPETRP